MLLLAIGGIMFLLSDNEDSPPVAGRSASPSPSPTETSSPEPSPTEDEPTGDRLTYTDYTDDWDFKLGDVKLSADYVKGWDYDDCGEFENDGALTDLGCAYGVEVIYEAEGGKLKFTNLFLAMPDEDTAETVVEDKQIEDDDFDLHKEAYVADFKYGKWRTNHANGFVVITICTATGGVPESKANKYLHYANADFTSALLFR